MTAVEVAVVAVVLSIVFLFAYMVIRERERKLMLQTVATAPGEVFTMECEIVPSADEAQSATCTIENQMPFALPLRWRSSSFETQFSRSAGRLPTTGILMIVEQPPHESDARGRVRTVEVPARSGVTFLVKGPIRTDWPEAVIVFYPEFDFTGGTTPMTVYVGPHEVAVKVDRATMTARAQSRSAGIVYRAQPEDVLTADEIDNAISQQVLISKFETSLRE